jgi:3-dehydroquinate synthase
VARLALGLCDNARGSGAMRGPDTSVGGRVAVQRIGVELGPRRYDVRVGAAGIERVASELAGFERRLCVITDQRLHGLWWPRLARQLHRHAANCEEPIVVPAGEAAKNPQTLLRVLRAMVRRGADRTTCVVALGGGAVSDLAGFAAATYMRGIDWIAVPTTLLAMVDAAIGGKTGIDLLGTKNVVGAFHQPRAVIADCDFLRTLPLRQRASGLGEVVKYGMIADRAVFARLERDGRAWRRPRPRQDAELVVRCCRIKAQYVSRDERESGSRAALNFGHTVGHALEGDGRNDLLHGEAVGLGMLVACAIATRLQIAPAGIETRLARLLAELGLPTRAGGRGREAAVRRAWQRDKKARRGRPRFVLTPRIGVASLGHEVPDAVIVAALRQVLVSPPAPHSTAVVRRDRTARGEL